MPKKTKDAEAALQKLGRRLRAGIAEQFPSQNLETVRSAVREQHEQEQQTVRIRKPTPDGPKARQPQPPEPDQER